MTTHSKNLSPIYAPSRFPHTYDHYNNAPWDTKRWQNFSPVELACSHCGEFHYDAFVFDALQRLRNRLNAPVIINSAHRCSEHNQNIGGRPNSAHLNVAFDIPHDPHGKYRLYQASQWAGFRNFGFYDTFLHMDCRPPVAGQYRRWVAQGVDINTWISP